MTALRRRCITIAAAALVSISCASRVRIDAEGIRGIESIAPVTFIGNRFVRPPVRLGEAPPPLPTDPTLATSASIFRQGVPAFYDALRSGERFRIVDPSVVLGSKSYRKFPELLTGAVANNAQLADGWRYVGTEDGKKIAELLSEIDADAALLTYWRFSLDSHTQGIGVDTARPHAYLRAWLIDRTGRVIADDELNVQGDSLIAIHGTRYDGRALAALYSDPMETLAVRLIADLSNARNDAREAEARRIAQQPPPETPPPTPLTTPLTSGTSS